MGYCSEEMETTLVYDKVEKSWRAYSNVPTHLTKFAKQGWALDKTVEEDGRVIAAYYHAPANGISIRNPNAAKRQMTDEQRAAAAERLRGVRR